MLDEALIEKTTRGLLEQLASQDQPDEWTRLEKLAFSDQERKIEIISRKQNIIERKKYAKLIFVMLCIWLLLNLVIVLFTGLGTIPGTCLNFKLSDAVIITLITTTTANIATFFLVVTKHLFPIK